MQRTFEDVLGVVPERSRERLVELARQTRANSGGRAAQTADLARVREFLLANLTNARYAVPSDEELRQMVEEYFSRR